MAYTPINTRIYLAAFNGAMAGQNASNRFFLGANPAFFVNASALAGAWAESVDQVWNNAALPNIYQENVCSQLSQSLWEDRRPELSSASLDPSYYTAIANSIVSMILSGDTYLTAEGIVPPLPGSGSNDTVVDLNDYRIGGLITAQSFTDAIAANGSGKNYFVPAGDHIITSTIEISDDTPGGNINNITIFGPGGSQLRKSGGARLHWSVNEPHSTTVTFISYATTGTQRMMRLGGFTGLNAALHTGCICWIWNCLNAGPWIVVKVHDSNTLTLFSPAGNPVDDSAASGNIRAHIDMPMFYLRGRGIVLDTLTLLGAQNKRVGNLVSVGNAQGAGASPVTGVMLNNITCLLADATASVRTALNIGMPYIPETGSIYYSATMSDGTDSNLPRVADSAANGNGNVSEGKVTNFYCQYAGWYANVMHGSPSGQSVLWDFYTFQATPVINAYLVPLRLGATAQANFTDLQVAACEDWAIRTNASNRLRTYTRPYIEAAGTGFLYDGAGGNSSEPSVIIEPNIYQTVTHPSGSPLVQNSQGPMTIIGGQLGLQGGDGPIQIQNVGGSVAGEASTIAIIGCNLFGDSTFKNGAPARTFGDSRPPFDMTGDTWELDLECPAPDVAGGVRTYAFTLANLNAAQANGFPWPNFGLGEVYLPQVSKVIRYLSDLNVWNQTSWADLEGTRLWVGSKTIGSNSRIRAQTHARPGKVDASVKFGLTTSTFAGVSTTAIAADTNGWVESIGTLSSPGVACPAKLSIMGSNLYNSAQTQLPLNEILGKYYGASTARGKTLTGQRFSQPGGTFQLTAAATFNIADTRINAASIVRITPTNASAASLMGSSKSLFQDVAGTVSGTSFQLKTADGTNAAGTETFSYELVEPFTN